MRTVTSQTISWLRTAIRRELQCPAASTPPIQPLYLRSSHLTATCGSCIPGAQRPFINSSRRQQESSASVSALPEALQKIATSVQQPDHTHYSLFPTTLSQGPPPVGPFDIDLRALRSEFLRLQALAHPDRHPQTHKRTAEALSARINEAYKTLQSPLARAQYLLRLQGIEVAEDESLKIEDPELLMEVLEAREAIEEAEGEEEIRAMKEQNNVKIDESVSVLDKAFREEDLETAKREAVKMRYWSNIQQSLEDWEPGKPIVLQH
ncbi:Co-chaperone HscB, C-terminal oligomerization domain-containing protein [Phyllosticta citriasiana]|uniref:Co-chaperone HscB, C-terminal oligomerization domain-containing protein n=1 Tax=Phyllosticta citriasiana TaxID=595635 RepID=A0ABR1KUN0_9PEZI